MERRCFIGLASWVTASMALPLAWSRPLRADTLFELIFGDASMAACLGARHIEVDSAAGDRGRRLVDDLIMRAGRDWDALRRVLAQRIADDMAALDTVVVDGWVMARSEADFCAAVCQDGTTA